MLLSVREGDFLASIDLKDAYFQIPVHQSSRKLLKFLRGGGGGEQSISSRPCALDCRLLLRSSLGCLQRYLCGLTPTGFVFSVTWTTGWSSPLRRQRPKKNFQDLLSLCHSLRIVINEEKADLVPLQTANYLGMTIDTGAVRILPSLARVEKFLSVAETFCTLSAPPCSALAGGFGSPGFTGEAGSSQSTSNALSAVALEDALVSRVGSSLTPGTTVPGGEGGSVLMDGAGPSSHVGSIRDTSSGSTPVFGRVSVGVGCTPPQSLHVRDVVGAGGVAPH